MYIKRELFIFGCIWYLFRHLQVYVLFCSLKRVTREISPTRQVKTLFPFYLSPVLNFAPKFFLHRNNHAHNQEV